APPWRGLKRWIARRWPDQVARDRTDSPVLFFELLDTLVLAGLGCLPSRPWVLGGSNPEIVCALGEDHRQYLLDGGVPVSRIVVTGQPSLDTVAMGAGELMALKEKLRQRYTFGGDRV